MIGSVRVVRDERLGGELTADAAISDTTLHFDNAGDFTEDGGQVVTPAGDVLDYGSADFDAKTLELSVGLATGLTTGDWIAPWAGDREDTELVAEVDVGGSEPMVAPVDHGLTHLLLPGPRAPGTEENVELRDRAGVMWVVNVLGKKPGIVGSSIDIPDPENPNFKVDRAGHAVARGLLIKPTDDESIALTINNDLASSNWQTVWKDQLGHIRTIVANGGQVYATGDVGQSAFEIYEANEPGPSDKPTASYGDNGLAYGPGGVVPADTNLYRDAADVLKTDDQLRAVDGMAGMYVNDVGRTNASDSDFAVAPPNGMTAVVRNSTTGDVYFCVRANGAWKALLFP